MDPPPRHQHHPQYPSLTSTLSSSLSSSPTPTSSPSPSSSSLFQVYLRLRPPPSPLVQLTQQSLYPHLPPPERWLTVEPPSSSPPHSPTTARQNNDINNDDHTNPNGNEKQPQLQNDTPKPTHITLTPPSDSRKRAVEKFAFTRVFEETAEQIEVFRGAGIVPLVAGVIGGDDGGGGGSGGLKEGRDGLVATLGVTGSGKSHTILGSKTQRGLTQLSLDLLYRSLGRQMLHPADQPSLVASLCATDASEAQIFSAGAFLENVYGEAGASRAGTPMTDPHFTTSAPKRRLPQRPSALPQFPDISALNVPVQANAEYAVLVSMYEVYNDRIFDLLTIPINAKDLRRRHLLFKSTEASPDRKVVAGLRKVVCGTYDEALLVLETGLHERRVAGTGSNSVSSRSHGFFVVEVKKRVRGGMSSLWSSATMTIVDLAGSERARNAKTAGATLAEAGKINESLMYLGQCLQMQSDQSQSQENGNKPSLVPFRQCKLTELLFSNSFPSSHNHHNYTHQPAATHHHRNPQKAIMIVTADPVGDFNATSQILRYSALAREVTVPRIPSVSSTILAGIVNNSNSAAAIDSSQARQRSASGGSSQSEQAERPTTSAEVENEMLDLALTEIARLTEDLELLHVRLEEQTHRRYEAEANWQRAEERAEEMEMAVREECWVEMEKRVEEERGRWRSAWEESSERVGEMVDKKIDIVSRAGGIFEDGDGDDAEGEVERENKVLRGRVEALEREVLCRSPTRKSSSPIKKTMKELVLQRERESLGSFDGDEGEEEEGEEEERSVLRTSSPGKLNKMASLALGLDEQEGENAGIMEKPKKTAAPLGSARKVVRKLTARKWDLMDESELVGYDM